jgi:hypothetical protein
MPSGLKRTNKSNVTAVFSTSCLGKVFEVAHALVRALEVFKMCIFKGILDQLEATV